MPKKTLALASLWPSMSPAFADVLINELQNFQVKVNIATGHDSYEAWREEAA